MLDEYIAEVMSHPDLVAFWPMQELAGNFLDEVAASDLVASGSITYNQAGPVANVKSARFPNNSGMGASPSNPGDVSNFGIELWIAPTALEQYAFVTGLPFITGDFTDGQHLNITLQGIASLGDSVHVFVTDVWKHIVLTRDSVTKLYIDGVLDTNFGGSPTTGQDNSAAGTKVGNGGANTTPGYYCMAAVYDGTIDAAAALAHYDAMFAPAQGAGQDRIVSEAGYGYYY